MSYADAIRRQAEGAPRAALPAVAAALWKAYGEGHVSEAEAEALSGLIEARQASSSSTRTSTDPDTKPVNLRARVGSRPRTDASMERRRRWAASGRLPPQVACLFTQAEVAVLAVVAVEVVKRGDCRLYSEQVAAMAGVSRSTVRATLRRARDLGIVTIEERRSSAWRNLSSVVRIASREWVAWNKLVRRAHSPGGGAISSPSTNTRSPNLGSSGITAPLQKLPEGSGRPQVRLLLKNRGSL